MKAALVLVALLCLASFAAAEETFVISSEGGSCVAAEGATKNCLEGTIITVTPRMVDQQCGSYIIEYNFKQPESCQVSNFVLDMPYPPDDVTGCVSGTEYGSGNSPDCSSLYGGFTAPFKVEVQQDASCPKENWSVFFHVSGATLGFAPMIIKGGQDCQLCEVYGLTIVALKPQCESNGDCDDGNSCTNDVCSGCGVCDWQPVSGGCAPCTSAEDCGELAEETSDSECTDWYCSDDGRCKTRVQPNCTIVVGDGDGGSDDKDVAKKVGGALGGLAGLAVLGMAGFGAAAGAAFWMKKMKQKQILDQLQAIGFTEDEAHTICDGALYVEKGGAAGENPFFVKQTAGGTQIIRGGV